MFRSPDRTDPEPPVTRQARVAMDQLTHMLRMAGYDLGSAPERLIYAGTTQITFAADIDDGDPATPCGNADETAVGGTLGLATRELVRRVEITLDLTDTDTQVLGDPYVDFELRTSVRLRNAGS